MTLEQKIRQAKKIKNRNKRVAAIRPLIEKHEKMLGKVGDGNLGKKWGVSYAVVAKIRKEKGIAPYVSPPPNTRTPEREALEKDPDLSKVSARVLANKYGFSIQHVNSVRRKLGIVMVPEPCYKPSAGIYRLREQRIDQNNKSLRAWKRPMGIAPLLEEIREQVG
jgi:hypothetical protein